MNQHDIVFYESWQMECCGVPFSVGSRVRWQVRKSTGEGDILSAVDVGPVDYIYDAHSDHYDPVNHRWPELLILEGTVDGIQHLYERFQPSEENPRFLIATDGILVEADRAEGFEPKRGDMEISGYRVSLVEVSVSPYQGNEAVDVRNSGKMPG